LKHGHMTHSKKKNQILPGSLEGFARDEITYEHACDAGSRLVAFGIKPREGV